MKAKLSPNQAFTLYGVILVFVFAFYLIGLLIGKSYVEETAALKVPESAGEPVTDVTPMLDFYQQLERRAATSEESPGPETFESNRPDESSFSPSGNSQESVSSDETIPDELGSTDGIESFGETYTDDAASLENTIDTVSEEEKTPISTDETEARYTIQIGAFSTEQEARQILLRLEAKNFPARLHSPVAGESPPYYRVWVGGFSTASEARWLEEQLKEQSFPTYLKKLD